MQKDKIRRLPPLLRSCWIKLNTAFQKRLLPFGITPDQYTALRWIYERDSKETNQATLAALMFTDANNISSLLSRMVKSGLIERMVSSSDHRMKYLKLTPAGLKKFKATRPVALSLEKEVLTGLNSADKETFLPLLNRLSSYLHHST
jgi:DNA-binding MarR family transcriptional regulator